jgi:transposase
MTIDQISIKMKINRTTVIRWLKRYAETGTLKIKSRNRKNKTSINEDNVLYNIANNKIKFRLESLKKDLNDENILISKSTIWRRLKKKDYLFGKGILKPKLSEKQKEERLNWAIEHINTDWTKVNFSDEVTVYLNNDNKFYWYINGNRPIHRRQRHSIKLNVWAFINIYYGIGNYTVFKENLNSQLYENILIENLIIYVNDDFIFQQDNHPVHRSEKIKILFKKHKLILLNWPANSPDLNPIENMWSLVKNKLSLEQLTKDNFKEKLIESIESIGTDKIYNIISSMHLRVQKIIDANGDSIDY